MAKHAPEPEDGTRLETDDEIRQAILSRREPPERAPTAPAAPLAPAPAARAPARPAPPAKPPAPAIPDAQAERPVLRPPQALLCILDDEERADGEWVRLRADRIVIGRTDGAVTIPHDGLMSSRHAEIVRQRQPGGGYFWTLADLQSTNGTFVRIGSSVLHHDSEFLIGSGRYRFDAPAPAAALNAPGGTTQAWASDPMRVLLPSLVEVTLDGRGDRIMLTQLEYWIGRDPKLCSVVRAGDMFTSPAHARLHRDARGQWHVQNNKSPNGVWMRVHEPIPLSGACQFRLGEQRFLFRGPS